MHLTSNSSRPTRTSRGIETLETVTPSRRLRVHVKEVRGRHKLVLVRGRGHSELSRGTCSGAVAICQDASTCSAQTMFIKLQLSLSLSPLIGWVLVIDSRGAAARSAV